MGGGGVYQDLRYKIQHALPFPKTHTHTACAKVEVIKFDEHFVYLKIPRLDLTNIPFVLMCCIK